MTERLHTDDLVAEDADAPLMRDGDLDPLFEPKRANELRDRWHALQAQFVDDPRDTVHEADALVAELLQDLAQGFADARSRLEDQWSKSGDVSTEDLRLTLQRYRSFFERVLNA